MKNNLKKKTWTKNKNQVFICGNCQWCNKELTSDMGGWIINAEKKHFCHNGLDGSCFDQYCLSKRPSDDSELTKAPKDDLGYRQKKTLKFDSPRVHKQAI